MRGGLQLGLTEDLQTGTYVQMTLTFARNGSRTLLVPVQVTPDGVVGAMNVYAHSKNVVHQAVTPQNFYLAVNGELPMSFVQALTALHYRPIPLQGAPGQKVVDIAILRTLEEIAHREADVVLVSNDGDFFEHVGALLDGSARRVGLIGFTEFRNHQFSSLVPRGLEVFDLEDDVAAFTTRLPRMRVIPIDDFDPRLFL